MNAFSGLLFLSVSAVLVSCFQLEFHLYGVTCLNGTVMKPNDALLPHSALASLQFTVMIHVVPTIIIQKFLVVSLPTVD